MAIHDLFRPLNDLKEIKVSLGEGTDSTTMDLIDDKIKEYETDIEAVDKYLNSEEYKKDNGLPMGTFNFYGE